MSLRSTTGYRLQAPWAQTVHDNFSELGGLSFLAIQVASRLPRDKLKIELPVARLYQGVTVRLLAELISQDAAKAQERAPLRIPSRMMAPTSKSAARA